MGDLSPAERQQVEQMAANHPAIKAEIEQIEFALESYALDNAIEPNPQLQQKLFAQLNAQQTSNNPVLPAVSTRPKTATFYTYALAATLLALITSLFALFNLYNRLQNSQQQLAILQQQNRLFANQVNFKNRELDMLHNPVVKMIKLAPMPNAPKAHLMLAWNPQKRTVMIDMGDTQLAKTDKQHQYQLWAMVNGKPVDLGVFDAPADTAGMKEMKPIADASVFAVTIEPRGGSQSPTLSQMVLAAKI